MVFSYYQSMQQRMKNNLHKDYWNFELQQQLISNSSIHALIEENNILVR